MKKNLLNHQKSVQIQEHLSREQQNLKLLISFREAEIVQLEKKIAQLYAEIESLQDGLILAF